MKKHLVAFVSMLALGFVIAACAPSTGCQNPERTAYQSTGVVVLSVDAAMNGWGDYVRAGKASAEDEAKVKAAYLKYQEIVRTQRSLVLSSINRPDNESAFFTAMNAIDTARIDLINLIVTLKK